MGAVSVRDFSYNPSALFARVEQGETIEVTRHGKVIAMLVPASTTLGRYSALVAKGVIRLRPTTTSDLETIPTCPVPADASPLDLLLAEREEEQRWPPRALNRAVGATPAPRRTGWSATPER